MSEHPLLDQVLAERGGRGPIPRAKVRAWMSSPELEVLGATFHTISDRRFWSRIEPALAFDEYQTFAKLYFGRCIREDPKGEWADSRDSAGWALNLWVASIWRHRSHHGDAPADWREWIADVYRRGDAEVRRCMITATLEHLFENPGIKEFFAEWSRDPVLGVAFRDASEWEDRDARE